jgi:peptide/nickel transport system permease protein
MSATSATVLLRSSLGKTSRDWAFGISLSICVLLLLIGVFGTLIAPYSPDQISILATNQGVSLQHLLGTDGLGRDLFSRVLCGAQLSLLGPALVVLASTFVGITIAVSAAWFGGTFERLTKRVLDTLFAFPSLLLAVLAVAIFGVGFAAPVIAISIAYTPYIARIVHSAAVRERQLAYVEACTLAGLSGWRICSRHIFTNVAPLVRAQSTFLFGSALMDLAAVSFLGLGVQPPRAEWGLMVSDGNFALLNGHPQESLVAGIMIVITVVSFNVLGERLTTRAQMAV